MIRASSGSSLTELLLDERLDFGLRPVAVTHHELVPLCERRKRPAREPHVRALIVGGRLRAPRKQRASAECHDHAHLNY